MLPGCIFTKCNLVRAIRGFQVYLTLTVPLTLTHKSKVWKKSGLMNWNVQPVLPKRKSPRWEPNRKSLVQQTLNVSATLQRRCRLSDKLSVLFEPRHARWFHSHCYCANNVTFSKYASRIPAVPRISGWVPPLTLKCRRTLERYTIVSFLFILFLHNR